MAASAALILRLAREPLVTFALIAALIAGYYAWQARAGAAADRIDVVLTPELQAGLAAHFEWVEGRAPTAAELRGLTDRWTREQMLFEEALGLGLHRTDARTRHRLIDTVQVLWSGTLPEPDEAALRAFYDADRAAYVSERRVRFEQVFYAALPQPAAVLLDRLRAGEALAGEPFWLSDTASGYAESVLRSNFGGAFFELLWQSRPGRWIGPVPSARGLHFVRVLGVTDSEPLPFEQVAPAVAQDYRAARQRELLDARLAEVRERYRVLLPEPAP